MKLNITIAPETEQALREQAAGEDLSAYVGRLVEQIAQSVKNRQPGEFAARMRAWSQLHPVRDQLIDDSREAIYAGCGE